MVKVFALTFYTSINWPGAGVYRSWQFSSSWILLQFLHSQKLICRIEWIENALKYQIHFLSQQGFLCMNTDSWVYSAILMLLALNTRISYEWLFQNLRTKYVSNSVGWSLSGGRNAHEHSAFINTSNSAF